MLTVAGRKICVAGASGFLGTWVCRQLIQSGAIVTGVSLSGLAPQGLSVKMIGADLRDFQAAEQVLSNQEGLIIASAVTSGAQVMASNPLAHLHDNTLINSSLLRAAMHQRVQKCVFISSSTVYPDCDEPMKEEDVDGTFFSKYEIVASMKKSTEDACLYVSRHSDTQVVVVRPGNAYGPHDHFNTEASHVVPSLVRKVALAKNSLQVWGNGHDIKNLIYARDLADGIVLAFERGESGRIYNLGGPDEVSIRQIVDILLSCAGKRNVRIDYDSSRPSMIPVRRINSERAARELGFRPPTRVQEGLRETYSWHIEQQL